MHVFSAEQGEPILVEQVKARSHGEPTDPIALVIEDVERDGAPKAGVRIAVHGAELVTQRREERESLAKSTQATRDGRRLVDAVSAHPGIGVEDLKATTALSGQRYKAALVAVSDVIEVRRETVGRSTTNRHYRKGAP